MILKTDNEYQYSLHKISKSDCEEIEALIKLRADESDKYPFINNIEGCGHINEPTDKILAPYIDIFNVWKEGKNEIIEFKCYANPKRDPRKYDGKSIIHEDRVSSFKCACACLNLQYFYILKTKINGTNNS